MIPQLPWKTSLVALCSVLAWAFPAEAKDTPLPAWVAKVHPPKPGAFPLPVATELHYTGGWSGLVAGHVTILFSHDDKLQTLHMTGGTSGVARKMYPLDAEATEQCDVETLLPVKNQISETYSDEKRQTTLQFTTDRVSRIRTTKPARSDDGKPKILRLPNVFDLQSSLLLLRSQPLQTGDKIIFLSYATASPYVAQVTVLEKEKITVRAGTFPAIKLHLDLAGMDKHLALKPYSKARNVTAWISDDADRNFLKFSADLLIGSVFVELDK
ncbi:MAG: DUF3108 domain-containing protein [Chthoniobacterales bacterium]